MGILWGNSTPDKINIDLSQLVRDTVHGPKVRLKGSGDEVVMYVREDGGKVSQNSMSSDSRSNLLIEACRECPDTYNSPTNIRRIWILTDGVVVEYYAGSKIRGKSSNLIRKYKYNIPENKIKDLRAVNDMGATGNKNDLKYYMQERLNECVHSYSQECWFSGKPEGYDSGRYVELSKSAFGFLDGFPWSATNVEEIYADYHAMSQYNMEGIRAKGRGFQGMTGVFLNSAICGRIQPGFFPGDEFFAREMQLIGATFTRDKYPRLRYIGIIVGLTNIWTDAYLEKAVSYSQKRWNWYYSANTNEKLYEGEQYWIVRFKNEMFSGQSSIKLNARAYIDVVKEPLGKRIARPGIYRFDGDVLAKHFEKLDEFKARSTKKQVAGEAIGKAEEKASGKSEEAASGEQVEAVASELELCIDNIPASSRKEVLRQAFNGYTNDEIVIVLQEMGSHARKICADALGIKLVEK